MEKAPPFIGPRLEPGQKVRFTLEAAERLGRLIALSGRHPEEIFVVASTQDEVVDDAYDGLPYRDFYSYQTIKLVGVNEDDDLGIDNGAFTPVD